LVRYCEHAANCLPHELTDRSSCVPKNFTTVDLTFRSEIRARQIGINVARGALHRESGSVFHLPSGRVARSAITRRGAWMEM